MHILAYNRSYPKTVLFCALYWVMTQLGTEARIVCLPSLFQYPWSVLALGVLDLHNVQQFPAISKVSSPHILSREKLQISIHIFSMALCTITLRIYLLIFALRTEPGDAILPQTRKNLKCHARSYLGCTRGHPNYTNGHLLSVPDAPGQGQSVLKLDLNTFRTLITLKYSFIVKHCILFTRMYGSSVIFLNSFNKNVIYITNFLFFIFGEGGQRRSIFLSVVMNNGYNSEVLWKL